MLEFKKIKFNLGLYISCLILIIALIVVLFIMYKYHVEGEAKPPFIVSKMVAVSSAKTKDIVRIEDLYSTALIQSNDIKIAIQKNPEYKKEAIIKKITINNFKIDKKNNIGEIEIYRPSQGIKLYEYTEQYKIKDTIEYIGAQETYLKNENLEISNQGGIIEFSIVTNNLGQINHTEEEQIKLDGTLLNRLNLKQEQLEFQVKFDLIIELESDIKLKTKITLDLPTGNILENGIETLEKSQEKTIFKRT